MPTSSINVTIEESDRQAILLAIGHLAVERPGWDYMLGEIAETLMGRKMYEELRDMHASDIRFQQRENKESNGTH